MGSQFFIKTPQAPAIPAADFPADAAADHELDLLIIGASPRGCRAAAAAAAAGAQVAVLDRRDSALLGLPSVRDRRAAPGSPALVPGARSVHWLGGHHALELLLDGQGQVRGAAGVSQIGSEGERPWRVRAGAIVLAASETWLMAVEAGAGGRWAGGQILAGLFQLFAEGDEEVEDAAQLGREAAAQALQQGPVEAMADLRASGRAGLRGSGRLPINPFALQAALQHVAQPVRAGASPGSGPALLAQAGEELARLDALWQLLLASAPAPQGALGACRAVAERLALARWRARRRLQDLAQTQWVMSDKPLQAFAF